MGSRERSSRRTTSLRNFRQKSSLNMQIIQNESVTVEMNSEENENSDTDSEQLALKSKRKFTWSSLYKYIRETCVGAISGTEPMLEDLDIPHRYRPENLNLLCEATGFSVVEMKRIYRGFKTECPTGLITEEAFHGIYSRFFPQGGAQFI